MSFFSFCKNLLIDPIGFSTIYFKEDQPLSQFKSKAQKVYFAPTFVIYFFSFLIGMIHLIYTTPLVNENSIASSFLTLLFASIGLSIVLILYSLVIVASLFMSFAIAKWILRSAICWTGFEVTKRKADDVSIYLIAHDRVLYLFLALGAMPLLSLAQLMEGSMIANGLLFMLVLILFIGIPILFIRSYYIRYKLIKKLTDANPIEAIFANIFFSTVIYPILLFPYWFVVIASVVLQLGIANF